MKYLAIEEARRLAEEELMLTPSYHTPPNEEKEPLELRPVVRAFAEAMERKLRENDHKPGWKHDPPIALMARLREETDELDRVPCAAPAAVLREAADVANFAMMYADVCGALGNT